MELVESYPGLLDRPTNGKEEDIIHMGKGASGARGDNTKTLKSAILEWLVPRGQPLIPPLSQNIKSDRGFNHEVTGTLLCPAGLTGQIQKQNRASKAVKPLFVVTNGQCFYMLDTHLHEFIVNNKITAHYDFFRQGFKHVFTSPSSVDKEPKATHSGNAYLPSMKSVCFSLSSSSVFSRTDTVMDSENFYHSILDLLEDPDESQEVVDLMTWWTHCIFPNSSSSQQCISQNSALSKIHEKHTVLQAQAATGTT
ncbi:hypothetical protein BD769DRAFT_1661263 [Suillus cothurnatus]|nr:hypothetical protein BD769DRAFT_1661263 [Suillus cothurnatus]